jgi:hypothetical protein
MKVLLNLFTNRVYFGDFSLIIKASILIKYKKQCSVVYYVSERYYSIDLSLASDI